MPCKNTGYFFQNICVIYNSKPKRLIDYEKFENNCEMLRRFQNKSYNKPLYETYTKDLAFADMCFGIHAGKL